MSQSNLERIKSPKAIKYTGKTRKERQAARKAKEYDDEQD